MWKQFTIQGNTQYLDFLPKILKQYYNTRHSSIKMTPTEASKKNNEGVFYFNLYGVWGKYHQNQNLKLVISFEYQSIKEKHSNDKGYTPNWTEEILTVNKIQYTNPMTLTAHRWLS